MLNIIIFILIVIAIVFYVFSIYNNLVEYLNRAQNAFGQIDVYLKRRYDLIPNLVEIARKYMQHEEQTLTKVIEARNEAKSILDSIASSGLDSTKLQNLSQAENGLMGALQGLNIALEAYPDLKANQNMMQLSEEISSSENKIAFARQAYNDSATNYNIYKQKMPNSIVVGFFPRFKADLSLLEFEDGKEELNKAPKVRF
ncbi:LemA family protein [Helicobacter sp. 16-1353]|uniref:LemA family protein n=1 Tax=Helicobacter sp. 16-1353 TaxID=2004996 RepID=UPI000DCB3505|nr:LemA family protein [Helicobacter sp. 16-1353]RAX53128.1 LemA family protein [Helicobacter sp. 16-1353]